MENNITFNIPHFEGHYVDLSSIRIELPDELDITRCKILMSNFIYNSMIITPSYFVEATSDNIKKIDDEMTKMKFLMDLSNKKQIVKEKNRERKLRRKFNNKR